MNNNTIKDSSLKSIEKVREDYNKIAHHYAETRKLEKPEFTFFKPYINLNDHILDVGCGTGRGYLFLQNLNIPFRYTGLDISSGQIREAQTQFPHGVFLQGSMTHLPFQDNLFNVVFMIASLHHLPSHQTRLKSLEEAYRVLKKRGFLCMTNWNLFQKQFVKYIPFNLLRTIVSSGSYSLKDFFIPWKNPKGEIMAKRYYYNFSQREIEKLSRKVGFEVLENFYTRGKEKVTMWGAYNLLTILKKR